MNHGMMEKMYSPWILYLFIPYNNKVQDMKGNPISTIYVNNLDLKEVFRVASQNDALWRAKRLGLDWMAFPDLDERVVVGNICVFESHEFQSFEILSRQFQGNAQ